LGVLKKHANDAAVKAFVITGYGNERSRPVRILESFLRLGNKEAAAK